LTNVPDEVAKGESFRIKVMEKSAYTYSGYDRPSSGATVTVGNKSFETGGDGYTSEIIVSWIILRERAFIITARRSASLCSPILKGYQSFIPALLTKMPSWPEIGRPS
jgi:hypothetical protein